MIAQQLLVGLVSGSVYALFALGFTLVFGTFRILNLAHGGIFTAGAMLGYFIVDSGMPLWAAFIAAAIGGGLLACLVDLLAFRRLRARGQVEFAAIVSSIGANLVIVSIAQRVSDTKVLRFPFGTFPVKFYSFLGLRISLLQIVVAATVAILLSGLVYYIYRTAFGRQVRAVAGNERAAMLLGVNPDIVYFQTFAASGALAGLTGVLIGLLFNSIHFLMGEPYLLRAFVVVVIGGLGSIGGAVAAGLLLGVLQNLTAVYLPSGLSDVIIYSLVLVTLLVRPNGLFSASNMASTAMRR